MVVYKSVQNCGCYVHVQFVCGVWYYKVCVCVRERERKSIHVLRLTVER